MLLIYYITIFVGIIMLYYFHECKKLKIINYNGKKIKFKSQLKIYIVITFYKINHIIYKNIYFY